MAVPDRVKGVLMRTAGAMLAAAMMFVGADAAAQSAATPPDRPPVKREIIPGSELMTSQERERYRQRIRAARSPQEEAQVRADHVRQMQERARLRGLQLPETGTAK